MRIFLLAVSLGAVCVVVGACGMMGSNVNVNVNANTNANVAKPAGEAAPVNVNTSTSTNANANANTAANNAASGPKRISFTKGSDWTSETITLAGGQSKQFVVGAAEGQWLSVESSSPDIKLLMITKKNVGVESEGANLGAALGAKGDYVFEVRNPGNKEIKTSIKVQITDEGGE